MTLRATQRCLAHKVSESLGLLPKHQLDIFHVWTRREREDSGNRGEKEVGWLRVFSHSHPGRPQSPVHLVSVNTNRKGGLGHGSYVLRHGREEALSNRARLRGRDIQSTLAIENRTKPKT